MFTVNQIVTSTKLQREFSRIARTISQEPQAFLITREKGRHMVIVDADIYQDLMECKYHAFYNKLEKNQTEILL